MYFNYHAKVQNLIKAGHAISYEFLPEYHNISPCLLIYFDDFPPMPIRQHKFEEYIFLLTSYAVEEKNKKG